VSQPTATPETTPDAAPSCLRAPRLRRCVICRRLFVSVHQRCDGCQRVGTWIHEAHALEGNQDVAGQEERVERYRELVALGQRLFQRGAPS
jgi:hypothetical protein